MSPYGVVAVPKNLNRHSIVQVYGPYDTEREADSIAYAKNSVEEFNGDEYNWIICEMNPNIDLYHRID
jgi:hypothetical protein